MSTEEKKDLKIFGYKVKHIFSPKKWGHVAKALYQLKIKGRVINFLIKIGLEDKPEGQEGYIDPLDRAAMIIFRYVKCEPCMRAGKCPECKCLTPGNIIPETNKCSRNNWGPGYPGFLKSIEDMGYRFRLEQVNDESKPSYEDIEKMLNLNSPKN